MIDQSQYQMTKNNKFEIIELSYKYEKSLNYGLNDSEEKRLIFHI